MANEKLQNIKQFESIPLAPNSAIWKNKTYDKDSPYSFQDRSSLPIVIEGKTFGEKENVLEISNRPSIQITDNTLINNITINQTLQKIFDGQNGVLVGFEFITVDSDNTVLFNRGIIFSEDKYIDFINYVYKGQKSALTNKLELTLESPDPNITYYIQYDSNGQYYFNDVFNTELVSIGSIETDGSGNFDENTFVDLREILVVPSKDYVDSVAQGLNPVPTCDIATTENITLANLQTIDSYPLSAGERVLVKDQTNAIENGIYEVVDGGSWNRTSDDILYGTHSYVEFGITNGGTSWVIVGDVGSDDFIDVGTDDIIWVKFSGIPIIAGTGLTKDNTTKLHVGDGSIGDRNGIAFSANDIALAYDSNSFTITSNKLALDSNVVGDGLNLISGQINVVPDESTITISSGNALSVISSGLNHNDMVLDGGTWHLTSEEHTELTNWLDSVALYSNGSIHIDDNIQIDLGGTLLFGLDGKLHLEDESGDVSIVLQNQDTIIFYDYFLQNEGIALSENGITGLDGLFDGNATSIIGAINYLAQTAYGDVTDVIGGDGLTDNGSGGAITLDINVDNETIEINSGNDLSVISTGIIHNEMTLQGGQTDQYYHLNESEHTELTEWVDSVVLSSNGQIALGDNVPIVFNADLSIWNASDVSYIQSNGSPLNILTDNILNFKDNFLSSAIPLSETGTTALNSIFTSNALSIIGSINYLADIPAVMNEPNGVQNKDDLDIYFTTLSGGGFEFFVDLPSGVSSFDIYSKGRKITKNSQESVIGSDVDGAHYLYYDSDGALIHSTNFWNLSNTIPIAMIVWNVSLQEGILLDERHGLTMDWATHLYLHTTIGTVVGGKDQFIISGYTLSPSSPSSATNTFGLSEGIVADEDLRTNVTALIDGNGTGANNTVLYRSGATGIWTWTTGLNLPYTIGATYMQYNQWTGATYQLTDLTSNQYTNTYIVVIPSLDNNFRYASVLSQSVYSTLGEAINENLTELNLGSFPFAEIIALYQITWGTKNSYTAVSGRSRIENIRRIEGLVSFNVTGTGVSTHNALNGLQGGQANEYYHLNATDYINLTDINAQLSALHTDGSPTFNDLIVNGNLTVHGTTTTLNTQTVLIEDNIILLNNGGLILDAGIEIDRGSGTINASLIWDETDDIWKAGLAGSEEKILLNILEDATPQLGGNLDVNDKYIYNDTGDVIIRLADISGGSYLVVEDDNGADVVKVDSDGDIEILNIGQGVILKSADSTRHRITVTNQGNLVTTSL